ncbi:TPA: DUF1642 domain-containing protein [Enterococcus faecalis]|uniref:DUF1642 domain-containing protein n=1 Tax=Enterococcus faecalis TaxID=1351 RepID=UPI0029356497|nr:DUF1642 domain-containing protein [Enterococcus faecalis]MDV2596351.1 DUF1642 domain-containing protein [Enterococcus faecalis]HAP4387312.1 DUF1642 domain-containing protein [Enterococcus faecalis]
MNKQELIEELEKRKTKGSHIGEVGVNSGLNTAIDLAKQLDEPKKVVIPQVVADWIKYAKRQGYGFMQSYDPIYMSYPINDGLDKWIDDNEETFAHAWLDGYEVEKEQLYEVVFMEADGERYLLAELGESYFEIIPESENDGYRSQWFTENQIKAIDERYWPFAVKVDGE